MSTNPPQVTVFHFTSRISNAKIRKYKLATERGMAPGTTNKTSVINGSRTSSAQKNANGSRPSPGSASTDSKLIDIQPPAKKPRLRLNVGPKPSQVQGDTIAASRPRRDKAFKARYSQEASVESKNSVSDAGVAESPIASSGSSSLSSAPPSAVETESREDSPFIDPEPSDSRADYGDFMSYYIDGGDEQENAPEKVKAGSEMVPAKRKRQSTAKAASQANAPSNTEPSRQSKRPRRYKESPKALTPAETQVQSQRRALNAIQAGPAGQSQNQTQSQIQGRRPSQPVQHAPRPRPIDVPPPYPQGPPPRIQMPPQHMPIPPQHMPPQPPPAIPQPIIQFVDIVHEPRPTHPETISVMIRKLQELSSALTNFGGVPAVPPTPPPEQTKKAKAKPNPAASSDPLDGFLSLFGDDGEEGEESEDQDETNMDYFLGTPGTPDDPLSYGIQFIQNALKSWAQQRITHQITQQLQSSHQQQLLLEQQMAQRRGPGRPKKLSEVPLPGQPGGPPPVIQTNLTDTPEGVAIKAFQSVLDSGCLQANLILPVELSRALRHLYMQIDHLINQGAKEDRVNWYCMSYGAQIAAHKVRVDRWKEAQAKTQEDMARQQAMVQMGVDPNIGSITNEQARRAHEMELERRRSMQHAQQQPYISQQHLHPMQFGLQPPGTPIAVGSSQSPVPSNTDRGPDQPVDESNTVRSRDVFPHSGHVSQASRPVSADKIRGRDALNGRTPHIPGCHSAIAQNRDVQKPKETIDLTSDGPQPEQAALQQPRPRTSGGFTAVNHLPLSTERRTSTPTSQPAEVRGDASRKTKGAEKRTGVKDRRESHAARSKAIAVEE